MFFAVLIVLLILYRAKAYAASPGELWFMISAFAATAYVFGFLDSRLFRRLDKKHRNRLSEAEEQYQRLFGDDEPPNPSKPH